MATPMSDDERRAFLMEGTRTGKLATVDASGAPHVAPIWLVLDADDFVFNTGKDSLKGKSIVRDGRVAISVDDHTPPFAFVLVRGTATYSEDLDEVRKWATVIGARYMGADRAEEFGERNGVPGELLVRLTPSRTIAHTGVSE